jgi:hypothetical protein
LREVWRERDGYEVSTEGDAFFVVFARRGNAVLAGVDAQRVIGSHPWPDGASVRIRIGMHTGEAHLYGRDYVGLAVHQAARVGAAAHGGQVLISRDTRDAGGVGLNEVEFVDLGVHRLKDVIVSAQLYQVSAARLESSFLALWTLTALPNNFPSEVTSFIGRRGDVDRICAALTENRLLTLVGTGGIGKTRLAIEVGVQASEEFPDGAWLVDLSGLSDPRLVLAASANALGVWEQAGRPVVETVVEHLLSRQARVVMGNCEHLIDVCAAFVDRLLTACPKGQSARHQPRDAERAGRMVVASPIADDAASRRRGSGSRGGRRVGASVHRARAERRPRVRGQRGEPPPGGEHLSTAGRRGAGDRTGRRPAADDVGDGGRVTAG